jgi:hypothetical protein
VKRALDEKTAENQSVNDKTREYLNSLFGEVNVRIVGETCLLQEGSTFVYVRTFPIGEKRAGVEIFSYVVIDVDLTPELMRFLLTRNLRLTLGAFGVAEGKDGKGSVVLTHTILGDSMGREELYASVCAIASAADEIDDQIVASFGGTTALGKLTDTHPQVRWE